MRRRDGDHHAGLAHLAATDPVQNADRLHLGPSGAGSRRRSAPASSRPCPHTPRIQGNRCPVCRPRGRFTAHHTGEGRDCDRIRPRDPRRHIVDRKWMLRDFELFRAASCVSIAQSLLQPDVQCLHRQRPAEKSATSIPGPAESQSPVFAILSDSLPHTRAPVVRIRHPLCCAAAQASSSTVVSIRALQPRFSFQPASWRRVAKSPYRLLPYASRHRPASERIQSPDFPPCFSSSRISLITIVFSSAFAMS